VLALVAFVDGLAMWLLSFVPGSPTARFWPAFVFPAFFAIFPAWFVTVLDHVLRNGNRSRLRSRLPLPLRGWRKAAGALVFGLAWLGAMTAFLSGGLAGQAEERDGRFVANDHGAITELTRAQWERSRALESRLFAGGVVAFAGLAALYLTQPPGEPGPRSGGPRPADPPGTR
jgi:hypothetical protein